MDFKRRIVTSHQVVPSARKLTNYRSTQNCLLGAFPSLYCQAAEPADFATPHSEALGFVKVIDDHTIKIFDRPGTNLLNSLSNVFDHPGIGPISSYLFPVTTKRFGSVAKLNFGTKTR